MSLKLNRKRIRKKIIGFNFTALFFFLLSCISFTFAWFAYSNVVNTNIEIGVSAWHIEFSEEINEISNEIPIKIDSFYPGSEKYTKTIEIYNKGDIDAEFSYKINYLRIFEQEFEVENQDELFDQLSHNYPFVFNISNDSSFIKANESIIFNIAAEWPLDSGDDIKDGKWGNDAYKFIEAENKKIETNPEYEIRPVIEITIELNTKQYIEENTNITDNRFLYGNIYSFNINNLEMCNVGEDDCYNFYVIDKNNKLSDEVVTFIIDSNSTIGAGTYSEVMNMSSDKYKVPKTEQLLEAISIDIVDSTIVLPNISERIVGNVSYNGRTINILNNVSSKKGYIKFNKNYFNNLSSSTCYWTSMEYDSEQAYAISNLDNNSIKIYGENKDSICKFIPIIEINKNKIIN